MEVILNGNNYSCEGVITVKELLEKLETEWNIDLKGAVVLLNDEIVKKPLWEETSIFEGAEIEVLSFVSGG